MNRSYEIMFIIRPDVEEPEIDKIIDTVSGYVTEGGGTVKKFNDGFYILLVVDAPAALISELERRLRVSEQVIKFITVRMDEEDKRVAKIKAHRDAHVKRSALPQVNAEAASAPSAVAEPVAAAEPEPVAAEA